MKKVAIVTGASCGIGRAVAKRLARDSFAVVVNYLSNVDEAEGVVAEIKGIGGDAVTVKAVAPGPVATELFLKGKSEEQIAELSKMPPLERLAQPEDIARVVSFLAGPDGAWVNSQVLRANGGFAY